MNINIAFITPSEIALITQSLNDPKFQASLVDSVKGYLAADVKPDDNATHDQYYVSGTNLRAAGALDLLNNSLKQQFAKSSRLPYITAFKQGLHGEMFNPHIQEPAA